MTSDIPPIDRFGAEKAAKAAIAHINIGEKGGYVDVKTASFTHATALGTLATFAEVRKLRIAAEAIANRLNESES